MRVKQIKTENLLYTSHRAREDVTQHVGLQSAALTTATLHRKKEIKTSWGRLHGDNTQHTSLTN